MLLYLHVPYCAQRCTYCDFYFVTSKASPAPFLAAVGQEMDHYAHELSGHEPLRTVYIGGGTPSRLPADDLIGLLNRAKRLWKVDALEEATVEVNPDDLSPDYLRALRRGGFDRLSIGVQSFFADDLRWMNRSHTAEQAEQAIVWAREAGFETFSVDLIFGLPEQPPEYWMANVQKAVRLGAPHVSAYGLTVEEGTPLGKQVARGLVVPAPDEEHAERFAFTQSFLREAGFEHYEVSSFARPGHRAVHNSAYWTHANYVGLGPSAHSFWWGTPRPGAHRWHNVRNLRRYAALIEQKRGPIDDADRLTLDQLANEYLMLRLRTADGLDLNHLDRRYAADLLHERAGEVARLEDRGLVALEGDTLRLTDAGLLVCDAVTSRLLFDELGRVS